MSGLLVAEYNQVNFLVLTDKLNKHHYNEIELLCESLLENAVRLQKLEVYHANSQYIILCNKLITEILDLIKSRRDYLTPYLIELNEKVTASHNCGSCNGLCSLKHDSKITEIKESHFYIRDILHRLQMMSLPLHSETIYPDVYRILRNQIALLENALTELLAVEETYLIPKVIEAQKNINARS